MHFDLLIRGGEVATSRGSFLADIGVTGSRIAAVGDLRSSTADEVLEIRGLTVLPGVIDTQVHFREPGFEHKEDIESGTRAAIMGGVTTIFEMPNTQPPTTTAEALADKLARARGRAWCDYAFFVGASPENVEQLPLLEEAEGTPGVKIFMGSSTGSLLVEDDATLRRVLSRGQRRCAVHAEDEPRLRERKGLIGEGATAHDHPFVRDAESARLATERLLRLAEETGRPVHILHLSTADELPMILHARQKGLDVTCEITPQHFTFDAPRCYDCLGTLAQMNPPIRGREHRMALWHAVRHGLIDVMGSDHAPHTREEKSRPYPQSPSGMPGVQTMLPIMLGWVHLGELSLERLVRLLCERPAEIYGIAGKGRIAPGYDADLAIVDRACTWTIEASWLQSKCGWSPFEGAVVTGKPVHTVLRGRLAVRDGALLGPPRGEPVRFVRPGASSGEQ